MTSRALSMAIGMVRCWTRAYTWGMPRDVAEARRAEIESDLWELQQDPDGGRGFAPAVQVIARLLAGVADDVCWRVEFVALDDPPVRRAVALAAAAGFMLAALWILPAAFGQGIGLGGRLEVARCANAAGDPTSTADLRFHVMNCAGAFFSTRAP